MAALGIFHGPVCVAYLVSGRLILCVEIRTCMNSRSETEFIRLVILPPLQALRT